MNSKQKQPRPEWQKDWHNLFNAVRAAKVRAVLNPRFTKTGRNYFSSAKERKLAIKLYTEYKSWVGEQAKISPWKTRVHKGLTSFRKFLLSKAKEEYIPKKHSGSKHAQIAKAQEKLRKNGK